MYNDFFCGDFLLFCQKYFEEILVKCVFILNSNFMKSKVEKEKHQFHSMIFILEKFSKFSFFLILRKGIYRYIYIFEWNFIFN